MQAMKINEIIGIIYFIGCIAAAIVALIQCKELKNSGEVEPQHKLIPFVAIFSWCWVGLYIIDKFDKNK